LGWSLQITDTAHRAAYRYPIRRDTWRYAYRRVSDNSDFKNKLFNTRYGCRYLPIHLPILCGPIKLWPVSINSSISLTNPNTSHQASIEFLFHAATHTLVRCRLAAYPPSAISCCLASTAPILLAINLVRIAIAHCSRHHSPDRTTSQKAVHQGTAVLNK
jgi:hypothetical protein